MTRILKKGENLNRNQKDQKKDTQEIVTQQEELIVDPVVVPRSYKQVVVTSVAPQQVQIKDTEQQDHKKEEQQDNKEKQQDQQLTEEEQDDIDNMMDEVDEHLISIDGRYVREMEQHNRDIQQHNYELQRQVQELRNLMQQQQFCYNTLAQQWNDKLAAEQTAEKERQYQETRKKEPTEWLLAFE